jgi:hypothetical protein
MLKFDEDLSAKLLMLKLSWVLWEKCDDYVISHVWKSIHDYYYASMLVYHFICLISTWCNYILLIDDKWYFALVAGMWDFLLAWYFIASRVNDDNDFVVWTCIG